VSYQLRYNRQFMQQLHRLPADIRSIAQRTVSLLAREQYPPRAKELTNHPSYYRLWLPRNHRLVYQIIVDEQVVHLLYVGPKLPDLYEQLGLGRE
jgi:mRNA-degrading endonuclease RelE of RelBE toxin-antitoxin system